MKKKDNNEERNTHRIGVVPKNNGITFFTGTWEIETITTKNGSIVYSAEPKRDWNDLLEMLKKDYVPEKIKKCSNKIANLVMLMIIAVSLPFFNWGLIVVAILLRVTVLKIFLSMAYESFQVKFGKKKSTGRFRKAAYTVLQKYRELGRVPVYEEVQNKNIRYDESDVNRIFRTILAILPIMIVLSVAWNWGIYYIPMILIAFGIEYFMLYSNLKLEKYCQVFITNKATEKELRCAIEGLSITLQMYESNEYDHSERTILPVKVVVKSIEISEDNLE